LTEGENGGEGEKKGRKEREREREKEVIPAEGGFRHLTMTFFKSD